MQHYREPDHDLDIAVDTALFAEIRKRLQTDQTVHVLSLPEVALAEAAIVSRPLPARTSFVHVTTSAGLLDFAHYNVTPSALSFTLGPSLRFTLPLSVLDRVETITWQGLSYQAGPLELALIPKAIAFRRWPNALNHVQCGAPNTTVTNTAFGSITGEKRHGQRQFTLGVKSLF